MADDISPEAIEAAAIMQKPKKKVSIWAKVFAVVVIVSMTGWIFAAYLEKDNGNTNNNKDANLFEISGYSFYDLQDGTYGTVIKGDSGNIPIVFRLDPRNASNISIDSSSVTQILASKKVYVTVDPTQSDLAKTAVAAAEISRIPPLYNIEVTGAYIKDSNPPNSNVPIRTCNDVSETTGVIQLGIGNHTAIETVNGCVYVTGKTADDLILAADKLGYHLVGILV